MPTMTDQQFQQLLTTLTDVLRSVPQLHPQQPTSPTVDPARHFDQIAGRIAQFSYDPEANLTFEAWFRRHEDIFQVDGQTLDEATLVRLLLHKLDASAYEKYASYILPKTPRDVTFNEAVSTLMDLFGPQQSLFSARYACMKLSKDPNDDFVTYAGRVNRECEKFKLADCNDNQFKCLIFVCGLQSSDDAFIRLKLLDKIESDPKCTIQTLTEECKRLLNLKHDTKMIEDGFTRVQAIKRSPHQPGRHQQQPSSALQQKTGIKKGDIDSKRSPKLPPTPCWLCGAMHFVRNCNYRQHRCSNCHRTGHKDGFCGSARRRTKQPQSYRSARQTTRSDAVFTVPSINCGQYRRFATVTVDGQPINFQVDSASDVTIINKTTWELMGKPELQPPSLIAHSASGDRIHFIGQRQCTYSFNAASAQGKFYVSHNPSNLLGAEWITKLGIYSIMDSLPCIDPGNPTVINVSIANLERDKVAAKLQATYPEVFKSDLGLYRPSKATLRLKPEAKPVFRPKRPVPYAALPASWPLPDKPWSRIHVDYAGPFEGSYFLVIVDAYSKWPEIFNTSRTTTGATIALLRQTFARYGTPEILVSDNGTQFTSAEFKRFCMENEHLFSPPYHPQSNGQAERFVDTFKRALLKLKGEGTLSQNLQTFLLSYKSTPCASLDGARSPAELFVGRKLRTSLSLLKPTLRRAQTPSTSMESQFNKQYGARKRYFTRGDAVLVRLYNGKHPNWCNGEVLQRIGRVLYKVLVGDKSWIRHANQLRMRTYDGKRTAQQDLDVLFDTFDLERLPPTPPPAHQPTPISPEQHALQEERPTTDEDHLRRSTRTRQPTRRLNLNPHKKSYLDSM